MMKTMTCRQLGGACDLEFRAATFEDMVALSQQHGMEMFQKRDEEHIAVMNDMRALMSNPATMQTWMDGKRAEFDALPADD